LSIGCDAEQGALPKGTNAMNRPRWSLKDAKNKVDTVVGGAIKGIPQVIVAQGAPIAVVLSAKEYRRLKANG
jgi:prevent-host-death family protein